jgi:hypothetical protein
MYAGGMSYLSECSFGFSGRVSAEAVAIDAIEISKIEKVLANIVENFIRWEVVEALTRTGFLISITANRRAGALS